MGKKKSKKKLVGIIVAILVIVLIVVVVKNIGAPSTAIESDDGTVQVQAYKSHDLSTSINVSGVVESQNVVTVTTDLTCKVKELNVALGDYVNAGDVLCVFDDTQIREKISELEAVVSESDKLAAKQSEIARRNLSQAQDNRTTAVNQATEAVNKLQNEYDNAVNRYNTLKSQGSEEAEVAYAEMKSLENSLTEAKNSLENTRRSADELVQSAQDTVDINSLSGKENSDTTKQLSELYRQLEEVNVVAEQSGIITVLNISQGAIPSGSLMQIEDNSNLKVKVNIKEKDILKLTQGMKATVTTDALPDDEYAGQISRIINFSASTGNGVEGMTTSSQSGYSAEIHIDGDSRLLLGMSAKVEIVTGENGEALSVPYDSIVKDESGSYVYRAVKKTENTYKIEKVGVTVGAEGEYYTAVTSDELKENDLIVNYPDRVSEGEEVKVNIHDSEEK